MRLVFANPIQTMIVLRKHIDQDGYVTTIKSTMDRLMIDFHTFTNSCAVSKNIPFKLIIDDTDAEYHEMLIEQYPMRLLKVSDMFSTFSYKHSASMFIQTILYPYFFGHHYSVALGPDVFEKIVAERYSTATNKMGLLILFQSISGNDCFVETSCAMYWFMEQLILTAFPNLFKKNEEKYLSKTVAEYIRLRFNVDVVGVDNDEFTAEKFRENTARYINRSIFLETLHHIICRAILDKEDVNEAIKRFFGDNFDVLSQKTQRLDIDKDVMPQGAKPSSSEQQSPPVEPQPINPFIYIDGSDM